jgi:curved DNA-binding protein CbpA
MEDYYRILGINRTASAAEIKKAYHRLARKYHPDSGTGDEGSFRKISEAYETLEDSGKRREYDRKLAAAADAAAAGASRTYGTYGSRQDSSPRGYGTYGGRQDGGPRAYGTYDGRQDGSSRADGTYDGRQDGSSHARGARDDADDMDSAWKIWNDVFGDEEEESAYESSYSGYGRSRGSSGYGSDGYGGAGSSYDRNGRRRSSVDAEDLWEDTYGGYAGDGEDDIMSSFYRFFHTVNDPFDFFGTKRSGKRYSSDADTESSGRRRASGNSYAGSDSGRSAFRSGNASSRQKASASGENASSRRKTSAGGENASSRRKASAEQGTASARRGQDLHATARITAEEAARGCTKKISVHYKDFLNGNAYRKYRVSRSFLVAIPAGTSDGSRIRLKDAGKPSEVGGSGNVIVTVRVG